MRVGWKTCDSISLDTRLPHLAGPTYLAHSSCCVRKSFCIIEGPLTSKTDTVVLHEPSGSCLPYGAAKCVEDFLQLVKLFVGIAHIACVSCREVIQHRTALESSQSRVCYAQAGKGDTRSWLLERHLAGQPPIYLGLKRANISSRPPFSWWFGITDVWGGLRGDVCHVCRPRPQNPCTPLIPFL
jgi:hypothetical protein